MMLLHFFLIVLFHPIHISVTEINYSEKDKALQIVSRIFIDDLELSIKNKLGAESLDLLNPGSGRSTDQLVRTYLQELFKVRLDGKPATIKYIAHEVEDAAIICYLEIEGVKKLKSIEITNRVIQETHADQSNLVHVTYRGPVKSLRLLRDNPTGTLDVGGAR
ncbi:MAG: DUF6702 family protein [Cytophagales bacterium]|nr:DUF6702 family protein [Cytophagales bacterium]